MKIQLIMMVDFEGRFEPLLKLIRSGWMDYASRTVIDYRSWTDDNEYYLSHDIYERSKGAIFMDCGNSPNADLPYYMGI